MTRRRWRNRLASPRRRHPPSGGAGPCVLPAVSVPDGTDLRGSPATRDALHVVGHREQVEGPQRLEAVARARRTTPGPGRARPGRRRRRRSRRGCTRERSGRRPSLAGARCAAGRARPGRPVAGAQPAQRRGRPGRASTRTCGQVGQVVPGVGDRARSDSTAVTRPVGPTRSASARRTGRPRRTGPGPLARPRVRAPSRTRVQQRRRRAGVDLPEAAGRSPGRRARRPAR